MKIPRLADLLPAVTNDLPSVLLSPTASARVTRAAAVVPRAMSSFGFECRLHAGDESVDIGISVEPTNGGAAVLAGQLADEQLALAACHHDAWRRLQSFAARWVECPSPLRTWVPFVFLEFDTDGALVPVPIPSVFVALDWPLQSSPGTPPVARPICEVAHDALALLMGDGLRPAVIRQLRACFEALPPAGWVSHAAAMLSRDPATARLSVELPRSALRVYLERLGWMQWSRDLEEILEMLGGDVRSVQVDFDVGECIGPKLGILLPAVGRPGAADLLERAVAAELCTDAKRDAVLGWTGTVTVPANGESPAVGLRRYLSHLKVSYAPNGSREAKAYLMVRPL
jgi:hypothetical protein